MTRIEGDSANAVAIVQCTDTTTQSEDRHDRKEEGRGAGRKRKAEDDAPPPKDDGGDGEDERGCTCGNVVKNKQRQMMDDWPVCQTCTEEMGEEREAPAYCEACGDDYHFVCVQDDATTICVEWCERGGRFVCCHYYLKKDPCGCGEDDCSDDARPRDRGFACALCHEAMNKEGGTDDGFEGEDEYDIEDEGDSDDS